jgi:hypothetical protein
MMEMRKEDLVKLLTETQQQLKTAMAVLGNDANSKEERAKIPEPNRENLQDWKQACARSAHQLKIDYLLLDLLDEQDDPKTTEQFLELEEIQNLEIDAETHQANNKKLYYRIWNSIKQGSAVEKHANHVKLGDGRALFKTINNLLQPNTRASKVSCQRAFFTTTQTSPAGLLEFIQLLQRRQRTCLQLGETITEEQMLNALISGLNPAYSTMSYFLALQPNLTFESAVESLTSWGIDHGLVNDFNSENKSGGLPGRPALYHVEHLQNESNSEPEINKANSNDFKQRASKEICRNFLRGKCTFGKRCFRIHPEGKEGTQPATFTGSCFKCGKVGHRQNACTQSEPNPQANFLSTYEDKGLEREATLYIFTSEDMWPCMYMANDDENDSPAQTIAPRPLPRPISDSGASHGITCDPNIVDHLQDNDRQVKHVGGYSRPEKICTATWEIAAPTGNFPLICKDSFFDTSLKTQIISEGQAAETHIIIKHKDLCTYHDEQTAEITAVCHKNNNLYPFDMASDGKCETCQRPDVKTILQRHTTAAKAMIQEGQLHNNDLKPSIFISAGGIVSKRNTEKLLKWHLRLGHLNFPACCRILNLPYQPETLQLCIACYKAKMHTMPHGKGPRERAASPLRAIWIDGFGPIHVATPAGCRWYLAIVDDCSRKVWTILTKSKAQWAAEFLQWITTWQNQLNTKIARVFCDVDRVFIQDWVQEEMTKSGIILAPASPYEHWMSGVVERSHRTIQESAQASRIFAGMAKSYWGEATMNATFIQNNTPKPEKTPDEIFFNKAMPTARDRIRVFGCLAMANRSKEQNNNLGKLADHADICTYLGVDHNRPEIYRLMTYPKRAIIMRYSVAFDETVFIHRGDLVRQHRNENFTNFSSSPIDDDVGPIEVEAPHVRPSRHREPTRKALENIVNEQIFSTRVNWNAPPLHPPSSSLFVPRTTTEANNCKDAEFWLKGRLTELRNLKDAGVYKLVHPDETDPNVQVVGSGFRYRLKTDAEGRPLPEGAGRRARLVELGHQVDRVRANIGPAECYASVATYASLRIILAIACHNDWPLEQYDVTCAYLHADPRRKIYMKQPRGHEEPGKEDWLWELLKCLYGDPESGHLWQKLVITTMTSFGFKQLQADTNIYSICKDSKWRIFALIWTDDFIVTGNCNRQSELWKSFISHCNNTFKLNYIGPVSHALGLKVQYDQENGTLKVSSPAKIDQLLAREGMQNCNPASTPAIPEHHVKPDDESQQIDEIRSLVGSGIHISRTCRPDLSQATNALARVASDPRQVHIGPKQRYLRYLKGTRDLGITMRRTESKQNPIQVFADSDYAGDECDRKSTSGIIIQLYGFPVIWSSKKQSCVALSSSEAEYIAMCEAGRSAIWLFRLLKELELPCLTDKTLLPIPIHEDNKSTISLTRTPAVQGRTKHVEVRYHWIRNKVQEGFIKPCWLTSKRQLADVLSKPTKVSTFTGLMNIGFMGMFDFD